MMTRHMMTTTVLLPMVMYFHTLQVSSDGAEMVIRSQLQFGATTRVRNFRGRVSNFNQSEARKQCFLASDWLKFETLPRKFRTLFYNDKCDKTTNPT